MKESFNVEEPVVVIMNFDGNEYDEMVGNLLQRVPMFFHWKK